MQDISPTDSTQLTHTPCSTIRPKGSAAHALSQHGSASSDRSTPQLAAKPHRPSWAPARSRCQLRPLLRPASTSTAAASSAKSCPRLPRREMAAHAAQSGEQQRRGATADFEAALRLRGSSETSRQLCGRFICTPGVRSQRGLRRSPALKVGAAFMGDSPPRQGTQWQPLGSIDVVVRLFCDRPLQ